MWYLNEQSTASNKIVFSFFADKTISVILSMQDLVEFCVDEFFPSNMFVNIVEDHQSMCIVYVLSRQII